MTCAKESKSQGQIESHLHRKSNAEADPVVISDTFTVMSKPETPSVQVALKFKADTKTFRSGPPQKKYSNKCSEISTESVCISDVVDTEYRIFNKLDQQCHCHLFVL